MTAATPEAAADASTLQPRVRRVRRAVDELSLTIDRTDVSARLDALVGDVDDRNEGLDAVDRLPAETNLLYTPYIDLRAAELASAAIRWDVASDPAAATLPDDADGLLVLAEGDVVGTALSDAARDAGVVFTTVAELERRAPGQAASLVASFALPATDKFAQMTRALWAQGVVLDIPDGVRLERPIIIRWALGTPDQALLSRTLVRIGAGAEASIVEELVPSGPLDEAAAHAFFAGSMEVDLGPGSSLRVASLQELPANVVAFQHRTATVGEGAAMHWALAQLGGRLVRSRVDNRLVGDRSSVEQVEIVFGGREQVVDLTSYTTHVGRDTTGDLLSKGVLLDRARSYMKGLITIEKSAVGTDSYLGEFGMNLSKATRSVAIPSLEIDQPDCRRAAHASSVGPIDETQLFYLESRGILPDDARKFIVLGFLEPVVARVPLATAQDRLRQLLEDKWAAGFGGDARAVA
jgi:Fe-S cluster assembly scaffold protein SufB